MKQSLKVSIYEQPFFKHLSKLNDVFLPPDIPLNKNTVPNYPERDSVLKNVCKWITKKSRPLTKTPFFTASPILLEPCKSIHNL